MDSEPDILLLKKGDSDEWVNAFNWLMPTAKAASRNVLGSKLPDLIEDNAIEAIEAVVEKVKECEEILILKATVGRIARNKAVDALKKHYSIKRGAGKIESLDAKESLGDIADTNIQYLGEKFDYEENGKLIDEVIEKLNENERKCVVSFYLHQESYKEIANKYDIPINSIGVNISRGLEKMKKVVRRR